MIGHGTFCGPASPISPPRLCQYTKLLDKGNGKSFRKCTSTDSFCKGNCVVRVDGIVYCRTIVFRAGGSSGFRYLYRQW
ncbi:hypothetical protein CEXT_440261 [Caerostris extrusa]|uniref:Uncharacterized protein n=1 Tax=Caerostris extrusa TaxID=172846 RepID=A0AAV4PZ53_CAEEX|nr:hypothetical protein CEXT_440261 [Caerostris extrusa]